MRTKLYKATIVFILFIAGVALLIFSFNSLVHYVYQNVEDQHLELRSHDIFSFLMLALFLVFLYLIIKYVLPKVSDTTLFTSLAFFMTIAGAFLIINCVPIVHSDSLMIYNYIERFNEGNYIGIEDGYYFSWNPALLGLLSYERILGKITMNLRIFFVFELLWYQLINLCAWRIAKLTIKDMLVVKLVILLSFLFFPTFFYILQVYGMLLGFALALWSLYFMILSIQTSSKKKYIFIIISILLIGTACLVKQQYQIIMIAMVIICILEYMRSKRPYILITAIMIPIVSVSFSVVLSEYYRKASGYYMGSGEPISLYIAMGLQNHDNPLSNGSFNGYNYYTYQDANFDEQKSSELAKENIENRIKYFISNPGQMLTFFYYKFTGTWNEPTYASIANGCAELWGDGTPEELFLGSLYEGDRLYTLYVQYMSILTFLIYSAALANLLIRLFKRYEWTSYDIFPYLYLAGGFTYHMLSESSARYVYIYVFTLIPMMAEVITIVYKLFIKANSEKHITL
ncbi:hypothetical protein [Butyrivibrio fibrisolvens]|uniref:hypothetical protein n=1 Tax=Butyrivibrio fibrisolvens TaxID=831 RepID=UPI000416ED20|nr:hypothetical protein [Butyrivibrio fibrisolvens]